jgi:hypothetical protein
MLRDHLLKQRPDAADNEDDLAQLLEQIVTQFIDKKKEKTEQPLSPPKLDMRKLLSKPKFMHKFPSEVMAKRKAASPVEKRLSSVDVSN